MNYPAGTIVLASDRQYEVQANGEWRRLGKFQEVAQEFKWPNLPFHINGKDPRTGGKCWCWDCIYEFHPKVKI